MSIVEFEIKKFLQFIFSLLEFQKNLSYLFR